MVNIIGAGRINSRFFWFNPPPQHRVEKGQLHVTTAPDTDFWRGTHYGFYRDNGHCLLTKVPGDFSLVVRTGFFPHRQYDQCGIFVRGNKANWLKASTEFEDVSHSRLGAVVTNSGWSDWSTTDVSSSVNMRWYRIRRVGQDFFIDHSDDGNSWHQLRISHMHRAFMPLSVGIYACSPMKEGGFEAIFDHFALEES